ncbi:MAG: energy transducer TonB [Candidatus Acidiferrum sp.]|jgi:protein TonB
MQFSVAICVFLALCSSALGQEAHVNSIQPNGFEIARRTFFDFGPPFDYYELFLVRPTSSGSSVERILLTPPSDSCSSSAKLETASKSLSESVGALLGQSNPCNIPEKELRRELKRCKHCMVFSGAIVVMQVQCGSHTRLIRADILDKDMFDPAPNTPEHTSWTMALLSKLDQAIGPGVMEKPTFAIPDQEKATPPPAVSVALRDLSLGKYDALFSGAPDKPSDLYRAAQIVPTAPSVRLASSSPTAPEVFVAPQYPPIARLAHVEGVVSFKMEIDTNGEANNLTLISGHPLLWPAVKDAASKWRFPKDAAGQQVQATIEFNSNCSKRSE